MEMLGAEPTPITLQNIQARIRGQRMWNWANSSRALFVQTSDMSEKVVGYTTIGGDLEGGSILGYRQRAEDRGGGAARTPAHAIRIPGDRLVALDTKPGPELAERQSAESELMPFDVLDACPHFYAG